MNSKDKDNSAIPLKNFGKKAADLQQELDWVTIPDMRINNYGYPQDRNTRFNDISRHAHDLFYSYKGSDKEALRKSINTAVKSVLKEIHSKSKYIYRGTTTTELNSYRKDGAIFGIGKSNNVPIHSSTNQISAYKFADSNTVNTGAYPVVLKIRKELLPKIQLADYDVASDKDNPQYRHGIQYLEEEEWIIPHDTYTTDKLDMEIDIIGVDEFLGNEQERLMDEYGHIGKVNFEDTTDYGWEQ